MALPGAAIPVICFDFFQQEFGYPMAFLLTLIVWLASLFPFDDVG
ncbi:hypothetical protein [Mixta theicola]|nr:hypothetical protein [Mixta theicola]